ncbi:ABC transporter ATP-binding protein [Nitratireductor pacificus]|uniref:Oligopeptide/dipeptide ABC transporter ATP-binding protein n=1 Tax=Nitratireductor pacificus pht-3B TaxID=391937 RepID=K2MJX4_9HYPH|nr:ABC transporter ATP-binding protein [Nitratireductor pacificus]EKF17502.1 oligopeptide/dipeptide ABC transporter ATP-binding protein [Nitratireductor pacificus pht-3B]
MSAAPLLTVSGLDLGARRGATALRLVEDVSLALEEGSIQGIVGESGSGKSLTCRAIIGLLPSGVNVTRGSIRLDGEELTALDEARMRTVRGHGIGMIFQNPSACLDPVMTIGDQIGEVFRQRNGASRQEARQEAVELLRQVGIPDPLRRVENYPHEFSGGMKQRAMIAAALACRPRILIADEPTTALDVTIQAQILRLLMDLRDSLGLSILLVTHDLAVVAQTCDTVTVMYGGKVAETARAGELLRRPLHPYTQSLLASQPEMTVAGERLPAIPGSPPAPHAWPAGCRFVTRCSMADDECRERAPVLATVAPGRASGCHHWEKLAV